MQWMCVWSYNIQQRIDLKCQTGPWHSFYIVILIVTGWGWVCVCVCVCVWGGGGGGGGGGGLGLGSLAKPSNRCGNTRPGTSATIARTHTSRRKLSVSEVMSCVINTQCHICSVIVRRQHERTNRKTTEQSTGYWLPRTTFELSWLNGCDVRELSNMV